MSAALTTLTTRLDTDDTLMVLAAAWDALTVAAETCDAVAFEEGSDELQAMLASTHCLDARARLPLPASGAPLSAPDPEPGPAGLAPYVRLLDHTAAALTRLAATAEQGSEDAQHSLGIASELAASAATALSAVRGGAQ
ncbi:hypothetical protein [Streptomyces sp. HUAS TT3]|uniref:hypothetical protein n=1 Tax=Streptomyces sp. HUAS TT3 TaxID=3447510 RepID=UPI003F65EC69